MRDPASVGPRAGTRHLVSAVALWSFALVVGHAAGEQVTTDASEGALGTSTALNGTFFVTRHQLAAEYGLSCDEVAEQAFRSHQQRFPPPESVFVADHEPPAARIALSGVEGIGVFAARRIAAGDDVLMSQPSVLFLDLPEDSGFPFSTQCCGSGVLTKKRHMDSLLTDIGELTVAARGMDAFLNHSPQPSSRLEVRYAVREVPNSDTVEIVSMHSAVVALRDLEEGDEVTYDYGTYDDPRLNTGDETDAWMVTNERLDTMGCGAGRVKA